MIGLVSVRVRARACSTWRLGHCKSWRSFGSNYIGGDDSSRAVQTNSRVFSDQESTPCIQSRYLHRLEAQKCISHFKLGSSNKTSVFQANNRNFSSAAGGGGPPSYEERVEMFDLDDKEELAEVAEDPDCLFLDIRGHGELKEHGELSSPPYRVVHAPVTMKDFSSIKEVVLDPSNPMFMEKARHVPIIIFCGIGARASGVQRILEENGYSKVYNAGGFSDLDFLEKY
jgi:rhodanese-related sulfurtransferase